MMRSTAVLLGVIAWALSGCASDPGIPSGQLSVDEIRDGVAAPDTELWVEPLTAAQEQQLREARAAWAEDNLDRAWQLLERLREARPAHPDVLTNAAIVAREQDQDETARRLFEEALKVSPGHLVASNNLALILAEDGDFAGARKALVRALQRHPDDPSLHYNLAVVYELYVQDLDKALEHYRRYQDMATEPDPQVAGWITDLERRTQ